jgi:4-amino-4-deoxy-L-arabinose transferase-like glycosyltransferase
MTETRVTPESRSNHLPRLLLVLLLSLSAYIQLTVVSQTVVDAPLRADASEYFSYAYNLHHHGVYSIQRTWTDEPAPARLVPDAARPPGYPIFLALLGTPEPTQAYLLRVSFAQAVIGVASVWLTYLIGSMLMGRALSMAAATITAIAPQLATVSTYLLTESLFMFLLLASVFSLLQAVNRQKRWLYAVSGLLWGVTSLVRATSEYFPVLLLVAVLIIPALRSYRRNALIAFACFILAMSPWFIRNQSAAVSRSSPSLLIKTLAHGSYPDFMYQQRPETFGFPYRFDPDADRDTRDLPSIVSHIGGLFKAHPLEYGRWYLIGKPYFFLSMEDVQSFDILIYPVTHSPYYEDLRFATLRWLSLCLHWPLMILGLAGSLLVLLRPRWLRLDIPARRDAFILALLVVYAIGFHMIAAPFPRYAIPFRPFVYVLAFMSMRAAWLVVRSGRNT